MEETETEKETADLSEDSMQRIRLSIVSMLDEFLMLAKSNLHAALVEVDFSLTSMPKGKSMIVSELLNFLFDKSSVDVDNIVQLLVHLVESRAMSELDILTGLDEFIMTLEDLVIGIPSARYVQLLDSRTRCCWND